MVSRRPSVTLEKGANEGREGKEGQTKRNPAEKKGPLLTRLYTDREDRTETGTHYRWQ